MIEIYILGGLCLFLAYVLKWLINIVINEWKKQRVMSSQSPIALKTRKGLVPFTFDCEDQHITLRTRPVNGNIHFVPTTKIVIDTSLVQSFVLQQLHFHYPSEHTVDGHIFPAELHAVFRSSEDCNVVLARCLALGEQPVWTAHDNILTAFKSGTVTLNAQELFSPSKDGWLMYTGSLTTPPYAENVTWFVSQTPLVVSDTFLRTLEAHFNSNARRIQPCNGRHIVAFL